MIGQHTIEKAALRRRRRVQHGAVNSISRALRSPRHAMTSASSRGAIGKQASQWAHRTCRCAGQPRSQQLAISRPAPMQALRSGQQPAHRSPSTAFRHPRLFFVEVAQFPVQTKTRRIRKFTARAKIAAVPGKHHAAQGRLLICITTARSSKHITLTWLEAAGVRQGDACNAARDGQPNLSGHDGLAESSSLARQP